MNRRLRRVSSLRSKLLRTGGFISPGQKSNAGPPTNLFVGEAGAYASISQLKAWLEEKLAYYSEVNGPGGTCDLAAKAAYKRFAEQTLAQAELISAVQVKLGAHEIEISWGGRSACSSAS